MSDNLLERFITSRYNFHVPTHDGSILYNAGSGAMLRFSGEDAIELAQTLAGAMVEFPEDSVSTDLSRQLREGNFIVSSHVNEVEEIRKRYWRARDETPLVLTITTTIDCNLGCYYCYEERSNDKLDFTDVQSILLLVESRFRNSNKKSLHIDWYGGEPLMNLSFMEDASMVLQEFCKNRDIKYAASVISNGTCWPEEVGDFIQKHRIQQVQISFDGLRVNHDRRRHYRKGYAPSPLDSPFERAVCLVDKLLNFAHVDVRLNIDHNNKEDVLPFIQYARDRGWFSGEFRTKIQPARLAAYSDHSSFMRNWELSLDEYDAIRESIRSEVGIEVIVEESEAPDGYPYPRTSVCAALANDSIVVGADKSLYRCGLQVGESHRSVGQLQGKAQTLLPILDARTVEAPNDNVWWNQFDPTTLTTCSRCSFLPICWAGCPKKHLEKDEHAIAEQGRYWRSNLPRLIATGAGVQLLSAIEFTESDQFRS